MDNYNKQHELEDVPDDVCKSLITAGAPEPLKTQLQLTLADLSFQQLQERIDQFLAARDIWSKETAPTEVPMEINLFAKGGKGKSGKGKRGKGKFGKQFSASGDAENEQVSLDERCWCCEGWGHRSREFPTRLRRWWREDGRGESNLLEHPTGSGTMMMDQVGPRTAMMDQQAARGSETTEEEQFREELNAALEKKAFEQIRAEMKGELEEALADLKQEGSGDYDD